MLYFTKIRTQPLFLSPGDQGSRHVKFGEDQVQEYNRSEPASYVGKNQGRQVTPRSKQDDDYDYDEDYKTQSKIPKHQDVNKAINFKKNRNQKLALTSIAVTIACFTLLGLFAFANLTIPVLPFMNLGVVGMVLGAAALGFSSMLTSMAISASGVSKPLPGENKQKDLHDGVISLSEQKRRTRQSKDTQTENAGIAQGTHGAGLDASQLPDLSSLPAAISTTPKSQGLGKVAGGIGGAVRTQANPRPRATTADGAGAGR
jgi:hypothetical protein